MIQHYKQTFVCMYVKEIILCFCWTHQKSKQLSVATHYSELIITISSIILQNCWYIIFFLYQLSWPLKFHYAVIFAINWQKFIVICAVFAVVAKVIECNCAKCWRRWFFFATPVIHDKDDYYYYYYWSCSLCDIGCTRVCDYFIYVWVEVFIIFYRYR